MPPLNRFFVSPEFSVYYRRTKQLTWQTRRPRDIHCWRRSAAKSITANNARLKNLRSWCSEPNTSITAKGRKVELLFLTFSASLVIQHATSMRLIPPKSIVSFTGEHVRGDQRLDALLREFVSELGG